MVVAIAGEKATEFVESVAGRQVGQFVAQVPFAEHAGGVSSALEHFGQGRHFERQSRVGVVSGGEGAFEDPAEPVLVLSGQQGGTGG